MHECLVSGTMSVECTSFIGVEHAVCRMRVRLTIVWRMMHWMCMSYASACNQCPESYAMDHHITHLIRTTTNKFPRLLASHVNASIAAAVASNTPDREARRPRTCCGTRGAAPASPGAAASSGGSARATGKAMKEMKCAAFSLEFDRMSLEFDTHSLEFDTSSLELKKVYFTDVR